MFQHGQVIIKERMFAMRFEVIIAVVVKLDVFCDITPYSLVGCYISEEFYDYFISNKP